jgi:hypothetical protein
MPTRLRGPESCLGDFWGRPDLLIELFVVLIPSRVVFTSEPTAALTFVNGTALALK